MTDDGRDHEGAKGLEDIAGRTKRLLLQLEEERSRTDALVNAIANGLRTESGLATPLRVVLTKESEKGCWTFLARAGPIISMLTAIISIGGLVFTFMQYQDRVREMYATTIYDVATEGRALVRGLHDGTATTNHAINYHYSVYYLQEKGVIELKLRPLLLLDLCGFIKNRGDFTKAWEQVNLYYPSGFRAAVTAFQEVSECTLSAVGDISERLSVLEEKR